MDSLRDYISAAGRGGPAGELLVRESLQAALAARGVPLAVAGDDAEFAALTSPSALAGYGAVLLDPWTFVGAGWVPRPFLVGRESHTYLLSFFGTVLPEGGHGLALAPSHVLTPYPYAASLGNTFLGYAVRPRWAGTLTGVPRAPRPLPVRVVAAVAAVPPPPPLPPPPVKRRQGVVWGKEPRYFSERWAALAALAAAGVELHFTIEKPAAVPAGLDGAVWHGHLDAARWHALLAESRFMLGLGDPIAGPSAVDALAGGAAFLNPRFAEPRAGGFDSQHPFLAAAVGAPYVCDFSWDDAASLHACAVAALDGPPLAPFIPEELTEEALAARVDVIFAELIADANAGGRPGTAAAENR